MTMDSFVVLTDSPKRFTVDSKLIYAIWRSGAAYGGCDAMLEVRTSFVGDGAQVKIKGRTEGGKSLGALQKPIFGNRLVIGFPIPRNVDPDDLAYFEVKLPKHGLQGESNRIPTRPPIVVRRMDWSAQEVRRGDILTLTTEFESGVADGTEVTIIVFESQPQGYHNPVAKIPTVVADHKAEILWEFDYVDSTEQIPTQDDLKPYNAVYQNPEFFFTVDVDSVRVGMNRESGVLRFRDSFELELRSEKGELLPGHAIKVQFADGSSREAQTDADGVVRIQGIPAGVADVEIPE